MTRSVAACAARERRIAVITYGGHRYRDLMPAGIFRNWSRMC